MSERAELTTKAVVDCDLCDATDLPKWHVCRGCDRDVCEKHEGAMQASWPDGYFSAWYCPKCLPAAKAIHAELCKMNEEMTARGTVLWAEFEKTHKAAKVEGLPL